MTQSVLKASNSFDWIVKFIILLFVVVRNGDGDTDQARKQRMQGNVQKAWLKEKRDKNSLFNSLREVIRSIDTPSGWYVSPSQVAPQHYAMFPQLRN